MTTETLKSKIREITGFQLKGDAYIWQAFTRSSVKDCENNEIFEMYGDSIISFCVMQLIHEHYGFFRSDNNVNFKGENGYALKGIHNESELDLIKKKLVSNATLASQIDKWGLAHYLVMGKCDISNHVENQMKIKADLFEAIVGAIAVTCNFDSNILRNVVKKMLPIEEVFNEITTKQKQMVSFTVDTAVTILKELHEKGVISEPEYNYSSEDSLGYFKNGDPRWSCSCSVVSIGFSGVVFSNSKKTAKKCVAYKALCHYFEISDEIARYNPFHDNYIVERDGKYIILEEKFF